MLSYLFYAAISLITQPNSTTICKTSDVCSIEWSDTISSHAHLEVQVKDNNSWISTTTSGKSFLSVIVDEDSYDYNWFVPQYLGQFWETPKRVVLEDMTTGEKYYSADFTVPGITLDMNVESNVLDANSNVPLSWSSNDNSQFGLYLLQDEIIIDTIHNVSLSPNSSYEWTVPYLPNQLLQIMVRSVDENTYAVTDTFEIAETTTTVTTSGTTTEEPLDPTRDIDVHWYILIPIFIIIGLGLVYLVFTYIVTTCCSMKKTKNRINRISPSNPIYCGTSVDVKHSISNPVYDRNPNSLPPISSPTNFRLVSSYTYPDENIYEEAPDHSPTNQYNKLNRERIVVNGVYI